MRHLLCVPALCALAVCGLAALPARATDEPPSQAEYKLEFEPNVFTALRDRDGQRKRTVSVQFRVKRAIDNVVVTNVPRDEIVVEEDGVKVANLEIFQPKAHNLTTVLAIDISGSMARGNKMEQAKQAAIAFLDKLDDRADVGLVLFDHEIKVAEAPARNPEQVLAHRERIKRLIREARPTGGTAYLDATIKAVSLLRGVSGRRAVIVMTDGVDMNSKAKLSEAIEEAQIAELPVYTIGIGKPGRDEQVTTVLVLDRSGSMLGKADDNDKLKKIDALKVAANRFVELMRPGAKTIVQSFSSKVDPLEGDFTDDRDRLSARISALKASGSTLLYDATYAGIETLAAKDIKGKRAVVVLTDGVDEGDDRSGGSRVPDTEVVRRAKEVGIPLYMLGLGQTNQINEPVMKRMAKDTGGEYYHAGSQKKLLEVFENLSIQLHDDGIDEASLKALADQTGGKYLHVEDTEKLSFFYEKLADEFQQTYKVTFDSRRTSHDGTARGLDVKIVRGGRVVSVAEKGVDYVVRGIVVPQMSYGVYLVFLVLLGVLLGFPSLVRRIYRGFGGT